VNIPNELPVLDSKLLNGYLETLGRDIVEQRFALYCQQSAVYLNDIESALLDDSSEKWQEYCHKMKGAVGSVGLKVLHGHLVSMEKSTEDKNKKAQLLSELIRHNQQGIDDFKGWLKNL